jgi:hypothetical protein
MSGNLTHEMHISMKNANSRDKFWAAITKKTYTQTDLQILEHAQYSM